MLRCSVVKMAPGPASGKRRRSAAKVTLTASVAATGVEGGSVMGDSSVEKASVEPGKGEGQEGVGDGQEGER